MSSTHGELSNTISQLARLLETILTRRVERSVYCKFIVLLFLLAASYGHRGSACLQDSGSNMGHLWFVVQIGSKWSYVQDDRRSVSTLQLAV